MKPVKLLQSRLRFSPKSKTGITLLLTLLLLLIGFRILLPYMISPTNESDKEHLEIAWNAYLNKNTSASNTTAQTDRILPNTHSRSELFRFDPNTISKERLQQLGLSSQTINTWLHYREKGGHFYKNEDLKKLYTLSEGDYQRLKPYLAITLAEGQKTQKPTHSISKNSSAYTKIGLNKADMQTLKKLSGIGSVFAKRIISFRNALGGFFEVEQLKEVYQLPDSVYRNISNRFMIDLSQIKKINLNQADDQSLSRHPYLRPYVKQILQLRKRLGRFSNIRQIEQISLINEQIYRKIAPYLTI